MVKGIYKITASSAILPKDGQLGKGNVTIKFGLGKQVAISNSSGLQPKWKQVHIFEVISEQKLEVSLFEKEDDQKYGYAEVLLTPLLKIPNTRHQITIHAVFRDKKLAIQDRQSAIIQIQIYYTQLFQAKLQLNILDAQLKRDTEAIGKMDPYVIAKIGKDQVRTTVKNQAGMFPKWNELIFLPVYNPSDQLELKVYDKDLTIDDLVGSCTISLQKQGYLRLTEQFLLKKIPLVYKQKGSNEEAGILNIKTRFVFNLIKPK